MKIYCHGFVLPSMQLALEAVDVGVDDENAPDFIKVILDYVKSRKNQPMITSIAIRRNMEKYFFIDMKKPDVLQKCTPAHKQCMDEAYSKLVKSGIWE